MVWNDEWVPLRGAASPMDFISQRAVFRGEEVEAWYEEVQRGGANSSARARDLLAWHVRKGKLRIIRRGVYAHANCFDQWLIGSRLRRDAVLAFDAALTLRELAVETYRVSFFTQVQMQSFCFCETEYRAVLVKHPPTEVEIVERAGLPVRVTSLERTFVDCAERLELAPELPALVEAFKRAERLDLDVLLELALRRNSRLLISRLAFFLLASGRALAPSTQLFLEQHGLQRPDYFLRSIRQKGDRIISRWNLIITDEQQALYDQRRR